MMRTLPSLLTVCSIELLAVTALAATPISGVVAAGPTGYVPKDVAIAGSVSVSVNDRVTVINPRGKSAVSVGGTGQVNVGCDAHVDHVFAGGTVFMRDRSWANGDVRSKYLTKQNQVTILGLQGGAPASFATKTVSFRAKSGSQRVWLEPNGTAYLPPGEYGDIRAASGAVIEMVAGNYIANSLTLEPGAILRLHEQLGEINLAIRGNVKWAGTVQHVGSTRPLLMVFATTQGWVNLEAPLLGSLIAPNATVSLLASNVTHVGSIWARSVEVHQGATLRTSTPCFDSRCFWEPAANALSPSSVTALQNEVVQPTSASSDFDQFRDAYLSIGSALEGATSAEASEIIASDQFADMQDVIAVLADALDALVLKNLLMEALTAGRNLAHVSELLTKYGDDLEPVLDVEQTGADQQYLLQALSAVLSAGDDAVLGQLTTEIADWAWALNDAASTVPAVDEEELAIATGIADEATANTLDADSLAAEIREMEDQMEEIRNQREEAATAFENFDQKANQLYSTLAEILKNTMDMESATIRNLL